MITCAFIIMIIGLIIKLIHKIKNNKPQIERTYKHDSCGVSDEVSNNINYLLNLPTFSVKNEDEFNKTFKTVQYELSIWNTNYPYAYAYKGHISCNDKIVYSWKDEMPTYDIRKKLYNIK